MPMPSLQRCSHGYLDHSVTCPSHRTTPNRDIHRTGVHDHGHGEHSNRDDSDAGEGGSDLGSPEDGMEGVEREEVHSSGNFVSHTPLPPIKKTSCCMHTAIFILMLLLHSEDGVEQNDMPP